MIKISVDESFGYDLRTIAQIKFQKSGSETARQNLRRISEELSSQIDIETHERVLASGEYTDLKRANLALFEIFDDMKRPDKTECFDLKADRLNYRRHECKVALQKRFFPQNPTTEIKLGYEKAQ
jgi:hypothetical protein